jgi:hypothetical protein
VNACSLEGLSVSPIGWGIVGRFRWAVVGFWLGGGESGLMGEWLAQRMVRQGKKWLAWQV